MIPLAAKIEKALEPRLDERMEYAYRRHYLGADSRVARFTAMFWLFFNLLFIYADYIFLGSGPQFFQALAVRGILLLSLAVCIFRLSRVATSAEYDRAILITMLSASACVLYIQAFLRPVTYTQYYGVDVLIIMAMLVVVPATFWGRIVPALFYTAGHLFIYFFIKAAQPPAAVLTFATSYLIVNFMGIFSSAKYYSFRRREYLARHQDAAVRDHLAELASVDELTGALNRRGFFARAEEEFARHAVGRAPLAVLVIDIDHFKGINDTFGHHCGDLVLKEFCRYVRQSIRECDHFGRLGGEEFALVLPRTDPEKAFGIAERLRQNCPRIPGKQGEPDIGFTVSIGVAEAIPEDKTYYEIQRRADAALYLAKAAGRNLVRFYGPVSGGTDHLQRRDTP